MSRCSVTGVTNRLIIDRKSSGFLRFDLTIEQSASGMLQPQPSRRVLSHQHLAANPAAGPVLRHTEGSRFWKRALHQFDFNTRRVVYALAKASASGYSSIHKWHWDSLRKARRPSRYRRYGHSRRRRNHLRWGAAAFCQQRSSTTSALFGKWRFDSGRASTASQASASQAWQRRWSWRRAWLCFVASCA